MTMIFVTIAGVIVTAIIAVIYGYQIKVTHDAERAWVLADERHKPEQLEWIDVAAANRIYPRISFSWVIKNTGPTPARILDIKLRFHCVQSLNQLPRKPNYGSGKCTMLAEIPKDGSIISQNDTAKIATWFEGQNGEPSAPTQEQMDAVRTNRAFLIACGDIRYKDVFNRKHMTRFCDIYHVQMPEGVRAPIKGWFSVGGPKSYNKTT